VFTVCVLAASVLSCQASTAGFIEAAKNLYAGLNTSVKPCDDFYGYACGSWAV
jgi:hypothetical protein